MEEYKEHLNQWKIAYPEDALTLDAMSEEEKIAAFETNVKFGTAGIRGIMRPGINGMNVQIVKRITLGLIYYMRKHGMQTVVICYDTRQNSKSFAEVIDSLFGAFGFHSYMTPSALPSPFLSYVTKRTRADMGIMITASHNTKEYNGYKVYDSEGCQISEEVASDIEKEIFRFDIYNLPKYKILAQHHYINNHFLKEFINTCISIEKPCKQKEHVQVLYTPLHGVGLLPVSLLMNKLDFVDYNIVETQAFPYSDFPTCPTPNPEHAEAWKEALRVANGEDIILATDPDADRVGIAVRYNNRYVLLSGNEESTLILYYLCVREQDRGVLEGKDVIRSHVTTSMLDRIAEDYKLNLKTVNTGFKNICQDLNPDTFLLGTEEAIGNLALTHVRDKDALSTIALLIDMVSYFKKQNKTLVDVLKEIYNEYGIVKNQQIAFMNTTKEDILSQIHQFQDFEIQTETAIDDRVEILMKENIKLIVRASGTEPKVKLYLEAYDKNWKENFQKIKNRIK